MERGGGSLRPRAGAARLAPVLHVQPVGPPGGGVSRVTGPRPGYGVGIRNLLAIPTAALDALLTLSELTSRLPRILAEADLRAQTVMQDIAAMRAAVEPLEERMAQLEREMRAMHQSLRKGMTATERGMKDTAKLQGVTNDRIGDLAEDIKPLGGGIRNVEQNTAPLGEQISALRSLMSSMLEELASMRKSIEPVASAAEPVARLRERFPGRG